MLPSRESELVLPSIFARELTQFAVCARELNMSRAAERLGLSQPSLSKSLGKLEARVGHKLFVRKPQGLSLTDYGKALAQTVNTTHDFWRSTFAARFAQPMSELVGSLRIGCHSTIAMTAFPTTLPALTKKFPGLDIEISFTSSVEVSRKVAALELDLGFVINPVKSPDLIVRKLAEEFVGAWTKTREPQPILLYNPEMFRVQKAIAPYASYRKIAVPDYEVIASMVRDSGCVGILPNPVAERYGLTLESEKLYRANLALIIHSQRFAADTRALLIREIERGFAK